MFTAKVSSLFFRSYIFLCSNENGKGQVHWGTAGQTVVQQKMCKTKPVQYGELINMEKVCDAQDYK